MKKEKLTNPRQKAASFTFAGNTRDTKSSEDKFQGLASIQSKSVRASEGYRVKDSKRNPTPQQHNDIPFTIEVKNNNAAVARHEYEKQKTSVEGAKRYDEDAKKKQKTTF